MFKPKHPTAIVMGGAGPAAGAARKCWNIASVSDDEGEIVLYGDVLSQQPIDWWTGEPEPGMFITPEGFMEDLETVKGKSKITVKLNSCGGDLYTGIAIHNAIKALSAHVNVVVEGIAASAASVIMCAGDTVFGEHEQLISRVPQLLLSTQRALEEGKIHPMILAARFHGFYEYLHPFRDGNGRIGRLFSNFILHKAGHPIVIIAKEKKEEYINALRYIRTERTDEHLIAFFFQTAMERMQQEMDEKKRQSINFPFLF